MDYSNLTLEELAAMTAAAQKEIERRDALSEAKRGLVLATESFIDAVDKVSLLSTDGLNAIMRDALPESFVTWMELGGASSSVRSIGQWSSPTSPESLYNYGDYVYFQGKTYMCVEDQNSYSPSAYPQGWVEKTK